jgi:predicted RNA-binding protein with TRAM domain
MFGQRRRFAPVKEGDELDVKIEAVGEKGDGIAKKQGFVLFVPNAKTGDEVRVRVTRVLRNAGFAEVIGGATSKPEEKPAKKEEEEEVAELEAESEEHDSEDFGEEAPEAEEVAEKTDEEPDETAEEEPSEEEADDSEIAE